MRSKRHRNRREGDAAKKQLEEQSPSVARLLDIPGSALMGTCQMELSGNREAVIDGCQGILEYDESIIKLAVGNMSVKFTGRNLQIKVLTHSSAVVDGFITGIEFIT